MIGAKCSSTDLLELKNQFQEQNKKELEIGSRIINYINDGANIDAVSVEDVVTKIKKRLESKKKKSYYMQISDKLKKNYMFDIVSCCMIISYKRR